MLSNEEVRKTCGDMGTQAILEGNKDPPPSPMGDPQILNFQVAPHPCFAWFSHSLPLRQCFMWNTIDQVVFFLRGQAAHV